MAQHPLNWPRENPAWLLASVHSHVCLVASKNARVGALVSDFLAVSNARSRLVVQTKSFFVLRRGRSGARSGASASVLVESWFASPKNDRRLVRLDGVGNLEIASVGVFTLASECAFNAHPIRIHCVHTRCAFNECALK